MYPIALDLTRIPVLLTGKGDLVPRRLEQLKEAGATKVTVKKSATENDIKAAAIVMIAGLPREEAARLVDLAHAAGKLVNVEDINDLCDFYFTANVRRGKLIIAISTSGASPTLARKIRDAIAAQFGAEWTERTKELEALRGQWKSEGRGMKDIVAASEAHIANNGWLA